jgi:hypothetical protein
MWGRLWPTEHGCQVTCFRVDDPTGTSGAMTSTTLGDFRDRKVIRDKFLALLNRRGNGF